MPDFALDKSALKNIVGITGEFTGTTDTQTLSGKTLTTPIINGLKNADLAKTANYTLLTTDTIIRADASAGAFTLTLPASSGNAGLTYTIIRTDSASSTNALTIDGNASETISTQLTYNLAPNEAVTIECDGSNWHVLNSRNKAMSWPGYFRKGSTPNRRYVAGMLQQVALITSTTGPVVNTLYAMPFPVVESTKFDTIECEVTTLGSGSNLRMGIYFDDSTCYPGKLLFDSGNVAATSTGAKTATITAGSQVFPPGLYWLTYENSATVPQVRCLPGSGYMPILGYPTPLGTALPGYCYTVAHTVGALPDPYTASATIVNAVSAAGAPIPAVALRAV